MPQINAPVASVDLRALVANYRILCDRARPAGIVAAVKANAYGLGMAPVAQTLFRHGCRGFFTAYFDEALALRAALPWATVAVLHGLAPSQLDEALARGIVPVINDLGALEAWQACARRRGEQLAAFVHLDTGMNRLGLAPREQEILVAEPTRLDGVAIAAWMSHLACADQADHPKNPQQRAAFAALLARLPKAPASLANSSGIFLGHEYVFDLARPGAALYGINPTPERANPMQDVVTLRAPILQVRSITATMTVGYGATYAAAGPTRVATLAFGYADGWHRVLGNTGHARLGDYLTPLIGRVAMDLVAVDVTAVPEAVAHPGAMVELIGSHRSVDQVAADAGTIGYEILTSLGPRIARVYEQA